MIKVLKDASADGPPTAAKIREVKKRTVNATPTATTIERKPVNRRKAIRVEGLLELAGLTQAEFLADPDRVGDAGCEPGFQLVDLSVVLVGPSDDRSGFLLVRAPRPVEGALTDPPLLAMLGDRALVRGFRLVDRLLMLRLRAGDEPRNSYERRGKE